MGVTTQRHIAFKYVILKEGSVPVHLNPKYMYKSFYRKINWLAGSLTVTLVILG